MYSLGIIQAKTNQFDGPLFRKIASSVDIQLTVYFTHSGKHQSFYDSELNHDSGWDSDMISGYHYHVFPTSLFGKLYMIRQIITSGHDLIIIAGYASFTLLLLALFGKLHHKPIGLRADSVLLYRTKTTWKWRLKDLVLPRIYRLYTTMHPVGNLTRSMMIHYRFSKEAIFLFPYAVDNDYLRRQFELVAPERNALRRDLGIASDAQVILGILKFVPREDPITLLKAYAQIADAFPQTHLVLVGDGHLRGIIEQYIERHALSQVHLSGYVPYSHLPRYFAIADVFVHPALVEPWGVTVNESLACGVPVIAADTVGAAYDLVIEGKTGFMFQAGNAQSLAVQLEKFLQNHELSQQMAANAGFLIKEWSYDLTLNQLRQALQYVSLIESGDSGG